MKTSTEVLTAVEFKAQLLSAIAPWSIDQTRLYHLLMRGRCPRTVVQRYARATCAGAALFCATLAELSEKAPTDKAQHLLLRNLLEEEGVFVNPKKGLNIRPELKHARLATEFARACGVTGEMATDKKDVSAPGRDLLRAGRWVEAVAFILVGQELKFAEDSVLLFDVFRQNGFSERDLRFFAIHREADTRHGQEALDMVIENSPTAETQQATIVAARDGARFWFDVHGGAVRHAPTMHVA